MIGTDIIYGTLLITKFSLELESSVKRKKNTLTPRDKISKQ